jgi:hypothetical protein
MSVVQNPLVIVRSTEARGNLRRFLVKLRLDLSTEEAQAFLAFRRFFGRPVPAEFEALQTPTSADFALVRRRIELRHNSPDPATLLQLLRARIRSAPEN